MKVQFMISILLKDHTPSQKSYWCIKNTEMPDIYYPVGSGLGFINEHNDLILDFDDCVVNSDHLIQYPNEEWLRVISFEDLYLNLENLEIVLNFMKQSGWEVKP